MIKCLFIVIGFEQTAKACGDVLPTIGNLVGTKLKAGKYNRNSNSLALEAHINNLDILEKEDDGLYMQDILRGGISNDDPRIPRNISK